MQHMSHRAERLGWNLSQWLRWQESLHPAGIDLKLERVREVWARLGIQRPAPLVITVAGTNGKGSCVALLAAMLRGQGRQVATYTSPHLLRYNERVTVADRPATDAALCEAFAAVDAVRDQVPLTYFEFGTLAALWLMAHSAVDAAVLEVGLGGRLDAVNVVDADAALISSIDLDHQQWLGDDRESIGLEKAGVFRTDRVAVCADPRTPASVRKHARDIGARYLERRRDFDVELSPDGWFWQGPGHVVGPLPVPAMPGAFQVDNAAGVLAVLATLDELPQSDIMRQALVSVTVPGRLQQVGAAPEQRIDVAHNPAAARALAAWLGRNRRSGSVRLVVAMLADKDHAGVLTPLAAVADRFYLAPTTGERGASAERLVAALPSGAAHQCHGSISDAWDAAVADSEEQDLVVACGSFMTVETVLRATADG